MIIKEKVKRMKKIFLILTVALILSGCGDEFPDMTEEQSAQVTEYAAGILMKYDTKHESRLLNDVELEKELARLEALANRKAEIAAMDEALEAEKRKEKESKEQALADTPVIPQGQSGPSGQYVDEFYGLDGISIRYSGYDVVDAYPDSSEALYFRMQAAEGKKLLVINFTASNNTDSEQTLDMMSIMPVFKIGINGDAPQYTLLTLLSNDLANYRGTLAAGEEINLVLVAEVKEEKAANIELISIKMQNDSNSATILMN